MPDEFKNGGFTLKTNRTTPEEFKNATIISHLEFLFEKKTRTGKSHDYRHCIVYTNKSSVFKFFFRPHQNAKPVFSNSSDLKSV